MDFNNITSAKSSSKTDFPSIYVFTGFAGMLANLFIILVLFSNKKLLKRSAMITGIAIGHFLVAFAIGATGLTRLISDTQNIQVWAWTCVWRVYPASMPFAFQSTGIMLIMLGMERFTLFEFPNWYRIHWAHGLCWRMVGMTFLYAIISLCVGMYGAWYQPMVGLGCGYGNVFGRPYVIYGGFISMLGGLSAVILTFTGLLIGMKKAKKLSISEANRFKRQMKLTMSLFSIAFFDLGLVVIPNIFFIKYQFDKIRDPNAADNGLSSITNVTYCMNTVTTLGPYLILNKKFRDSALNLFIRCKKNTVTPIVKIELKTVGARPAESD